MLHTQKFFVFSNEQFEKIIEHLVESSRKLEEANYYALFFPNNTVCANVILKFNENRPKEIEHDQSSKIHIQEVVATSENLTTSIFNSKQERLFFFALRSCYPTYYIYPNLTLSTIINIITVEDILNLNERRFFYNSTIDFVIIDQFNDFKPVFAIELDSEWHRLGNQSEKDEIKNKVLKAVGLKLYRIEHIAKNKTVEEFQQLIIETINVPAINLKN